MNTVAPSSPVSTPAERPSSGVAELLRLVRDVDTGACDGDTDAGQPRHRDRNAIRDDEHAAQSLALAAESQDLRNRADRYALVLNRGDTVDRTRIAAVLRGFRAYRTFLPDLDRARNDAARRRLLAAREAARDAWSHSASA